MGIFRGETLACALLVGAIAVGAARAGEVQAEAVACHKQKQTCCSPPGPAVTACNNPCDRCNVGPIRRWLRGCYRKQCTTCKPACAPPCPPPCPPLVVPARPPIVVAPAPVFAPSMPPAAPPASIGGPAPSPFPPAAPPAPVVPSASGMYRQSAPTQAPPIRADRIASTGGDIVTRAKVDPFVQVTLVSSRKEEAHQKANTDQGGRIRANLTAGTWFIYSRNDEGKNVYRGKLDVHEAGTITVRIQ
ncbi:MAG: hypothetical protein U0840_26895 [Gemmataceae bacterium]